MQTDVVVVAAVAEGVAALMLEGLSWCWRLHSPSKAYCRAYIFRGGSMRQGASTQQSTSAQSDLVRRPCLGLEHTLPCPVMALDRGE